jgi:8-oxo-dGTP diphosphatase/2-hydroxy-dATP diphosphatase
MYNGFGGKVEEGETIEQAAKRELTEECGIIPLDMRKRGVLQFEMQEAGNPFKFDPLMEVHVFSATQFQGEPVETQEMRPEWFGQSEIPYDNMWPDDRFWLPMLLSGKNFEGSFLLADKSTIISHELREV